MTEFEYLAVLVSIILGLGITHLLLGVGRMIHRRTDMALDPVHSMWTFSAFIILILNWWVFFRSQSLSTWTFDVFFIVIAWAVLIYLMVVVLFPPGILGDENYGEVFERNRRWFLGLWVIFNFSDIGLTALRGDLMDPPLYLPFVLHFAVLGSIGMLVNSRRYHLFFAAYVLFISLVWALLVRRLLAV